MLSTYFFFRDHDKVFLALKNAVILSKCLSCGLWNNSPFVSKQIEKIGAMLSSTLVAAKYTTFESIAKQDPRQLEMAMGKSAPFGNHVRNSAMHFPSYELSVIQVFK